MDKRNLFLKEIVKRMPEKEQDIDEDGGMLMGGM